METDRNNEQDETAAPPKLVAALRRTQSARVFVPPTVDEAVLRAARKHLERPARGENSRVWFRFRWLGLASACVVVATIVYFRNSDSHQSFAREDLNHDGQVDILDAFQLARELQSGTKPSPALDLNGDDIVDRRDAEIIAAQAVKLEKGGRS
jgi:hypothetical protein